MVFRKNPVKSECAEVVTGSCCVCWAEVRCPAWLTPADDGQRYPSQERLCSQEENSAPCAPHPVTFYAYRMIGGLLYLKEAENGI